MQTPLDETPRLAIPPDVREFLRCPVCKGELLLAAGTLTCVNSICESAFPIVGGIPVLINEQTSVFAIEDFVQRRSTFFDLSAKAQLVERMEGLLPTFHRQATTRANYHCLAEHLLNQASAPLVLVVGGSIVGHGMEPLLRHCPPIRLIESDVSFGPRTVLICDAHDIPFADNVFDGVIAQAVLEHVVDPWRCVAEMHRVLKPAGLIYTQTPFMYPVHGAPYDFTRFTHLGYRRLFRAFTEIGSGAVDGPGTALAMAYQYFLLSFFTSRPVRGIVRGLTRLTASYLKYFDAYLAHKPGMLDAPAGYYFLGRKSDQILADRELIKLYRGGLTR